MDTLTKPSAPASTSTEDLLSATLAAAVKDGQTVTAEGEPAASPLHGVQLDGVRRRRVTTHVDERGSLFEMFDPRWEWHPDPLVYAYVATIRPGVAKGWAIHKLHDDRYFLMYGEAEVVLYDVRVDSPTFGQVSRVRMSGFDRGLLSIPRHVWHATRNLGLTDVVFANFPTIQFDHANPDKYRLPLDTPLIPFSFEGSRGW